MVAFLQYFHEFLELGNIKKSGENLGQSKTFVVLMGQFLAISGNKSNFEISQIRDFGHFQAFLGKLFELLFLFQMRFSSKIVLKTRGGDRAARMRFKFSINKKMMSAARIRGACLRADLRGSARTPFESAVPRLP
jgi:hypothetical protein